jgi:hypothetical protein
MEQLPEMLQAYGIALFIKMVMIFPYLWWVRKQFDAPSMGAGVPVTFLLLFVGMEANGLTRIVHPAAVVAFVLRCALWFGVIVFAYDRKRSTLVKDGGIAAGGVAISFFSDVPLSFLVIQAAFANARWC